MKLAVMQPYLFPYIGYFQLIHSVDKFVVYDDVSFINHGWINRNRILVNGNAYLFTVPLKKASQNKLIKDIEIADEPNWKEKLLRTIETNYKKAPCFNSAIPLITDIMLMKEKTISKMIAQSIIAINKHLGIQTTIQTTSTVYNNSHLTAQDRILDICRKEQADHYINPIGGRELYLKERFSKENIDLVFLKTAPIIYRQFTHEFIPSLSIIDVMMFNSKEEIQNFLDHYELI